MSEQLLSSFSSVKVVYNYGLREPKPLLYSEALLHTIEPSLEVQKLGDYPMKNMDTESLFFRAIVFNYGYRVPGLAVSKGLKQLKKEEICKKDKRMTDWRDGRKGERRMCNI